MIAPNRAPDAQEGNRRTARILLLIIAALALAALLTGIRW